jgi:hypothetical protein
MNAFIENDKRCEQPCGCFVHTTCGFNMIHSHIWVNPWLDLHCVTCNTVIFRSLNIVNEQLAVAAAENRCDTLLKQVTFRKDLRALRKSIRARNAAIHKFKTAVRTRHRLFLAANSVALTELRAAKAELIRNTKLSIDCVTCTKASRKAAAAMTRFTRKYGLESHELRQLRLKIGRRWSDRVSTILTHGFRVKI